MCWFVDVKHNVYWKYGCETQCIGSVDVKHNVLGSMDVKHNALEVWM